MGPPVAGRLSIRAAVVIGFALTLALWVGTAYRFSAQLADAERDAAAVTARHNRAQDLLSTVRAQILLISVHVRDALLDPDRSATPKYRGRLDGAYFHLNAALEEYASLPVAPGQGDDVRHLRGEVEQFRRTMTEMLDLHASGGPVDVRDLLNRRMVPRRESALGFSEQVQALNRAAFVEQQRASGRIRREVEYESARMLALGLLASFAVAFLATAYAGRLEDRLRQQREREATINADLQRLSSRLVRVQEDERRTLARELHDEVGQLLTAVKVELTVARRSVVAAAQAPAPLDDALGLADGALQTVRHLSQALHPQVLDDLGLSAAIDWYLRGVRRRHELRVELVSDGPDHRVDPDTELAAYRLVQEAVTNTIRHAAATTCQVHVHRSADALVVRVEDDGRGFDPAAVAREARRPDAAARGLGLIGMRERVTQLGGTFVIESAAARGTRVVAHLPVAPPADPPATVEISHALAARGEEPARA